MSKCLLRVNFFHIATLVAGKVGTTACRTRLYFSFFKVRWNVRASVVQTSDFYIHLADSRSRSPPYISACLSGPWRSFLTDLTTLRF